MRESIKDQLGARCLTDILNFLARRQKWLLNRCYSKSSGLQVSCAMYNAEKNEVIPTKWPLAKVINTYPEEDGIVRVVDIKTSKGLYRRPVHKLALLLPIETEEQ